MPERKTTARNRMSRDPRQEDVLAVPRRLPRGIASLPQDVVVLSQRARLVEATAHVVAEKGYAAATVADIIGRAGVSRATFYELYSDKEDCFLSCFTGLARTHNQVVADVLKGPGPLPQRLVAGIRAYLRRVDADHWYARAFVAEAEGASPRIREAFEHAKDEMDRALRAWFREVLEAHPEVPPADAATRELLRAGLSGFVIGRVRAGSAALEPQTPALAAFVFATLGLYGWARRAGSPSTRFGSPLR